MSGTDKNDTAASNGVPILDGSNYTNWQSRMFIYLCGKDLWDCCTVPIAITATEAEKLVYIKLGHKAISIITSRINARCYNEVVNSVTNSNPILLWKKISSQYASHSVINRGRVFMNWSAEIYMGNLQDYIDRTRAHLLDIDAVGITLPKDIISYLVLGKLMHDDKLDKIIDNCALSEDCTSDPYLVLNSLQTWLTHKNAKVEKEEGTALVTSSNSQTKFPFKIIHYCANQVHNPECTTHVESKCYEKYPHLRPSPSSKSKNASASFAHASVFVSYISGQPTEDIVIDSAASHHMLRDRSLFSSFTREKVLIKTGNPDSPLVATGHGIAEIFTNGRVIKLVDCLLVPTISQQLISLVRLIDSSVNIVKNSQFFDISDSTGSIFSGEIVDNLLHAQYIKCPKALVNIKASDHELWHLPLGHPGNEVMKLMGLPTSKADSMCEAKSDAFEEFERFVNLVENLQDHKVKEIVSDQGGEFVNGRFDSFVAKKGILQTFSPAETPQLNGFAERANRTILDKARCLLLTSSLPKTYWAEAVNAATFISNMPFGCKAFIAVPKHRRDWKLGKTGEVGILVGFENEASVYRILRLRDRKLVKTRHVRFDEHIFPKISNDSVPFAMSEELREGEWAHDSFEADSDASSDSSDKPAVDDEPPARPPPDLPPPTRLSVVGPRHPTLINGDISTDHILPFKRDRRPRAFVTTTGEDIPNHYHQAVKGPESAGWVAAIDKELSAMRTLKVWDAVDLLPTMKTVGTTWVFRKKKDGSSVVFKARLCAQGFSQVYGIDFSKTFAPTGRLNSLRALISYAASNNLEFHQLDVKTAFLNADLDEEVFLSIPQGVNLDKKKCCLKLNKAIYGLKQAPLAWYNRLSQWLVSVGFKIAVSDPCVFYRLGDTPVWVFVHVDDLAVFSKNVQPFKDQINAEFDMKDMGRADLMLGIKILHEDGAIFLSQLHYVNSVLDLYGMTNCRSVSTPLTPNLHLDKASISDQDCFKSLGVNYRSAVGALSYLLTATRPDISYAVSSLSQFLEAPGIQHWEAFIHVLRYLSGTAGNALVYNRGLPSVLNGYTDADWGNCPATQRLVTGYLSQMNDHLVSWQTKKQPVVSLSSCEAEYRALTDFSCEILWLRQFLHEIHITLSDAPTVVHEDNQGCIAVANFEANTNAKRMKHVEIQLHFIREVIKDSKILLQYTPTNKMLADFLTKSVARPALVKSLQSLGLLRLEGRGGVDIHVTSL